MDSKRASPPPTSTPTTISRSASDAGSILQNKYQLGRLLGRGSFAKVYYARSLSDDSSVAVKVIYKPKIPDPATEPRLVREVSAMRRLNHHPNILKLHEVMATKTKIYLVMELAEGGELFAQLTRRGRMPESTARRYFQQLVSTLHFCHRNGITHRDLKPQNLLLDAEGNLKISDFGLSALPEQQKDGLLQTACGTPAYSAPEVFRRKGYDGAKADAFSCGVILFVFLAGYLPFDDSNLPNMYRKIHQREFLFPDWISKSARNIIYKLLDPNPNTRMSIETLMGLAWFKKSFNSDPTIGLELLGEKDCKCEATMNAFDIISMSSGLDLSGIFEENLRRKERRFTTAASVELVENRVVEVGERLGYRVKWEEKGRDIGLVNGRRGVLVKIFTVAPEVLLVEMKVIDGGDGLEEGQWEELSVGLQDIIISWHDDVVVC